jgi:hypothetical protein
LSDDTDDENTPDPTGRGHSLFLEHETGLAGARRCAACALRLPSEARPRTGDTYVGKEMLALISLRDFDRSGHIGSFRSIVGEAPEKITLGAMEARATVG